MSRLILLYVASLLIGSCMGEERESETAELEAKRPRAEMKIVLEGLHQNTVFLNTKDSVVVRLLANVESHLDKLEAEIIQLKRKVNEIDQLHSNGSAAAEPVIKDAHEQLDAVLKKSANFEAALEVMSQGSDVLVKPLEPLERTSCFMKEEQSNGVYRISVPQYGSQPFEVFCANHSQHGNGWTVVLRRQDGSVDFDRDWNDYKHGFGNLRGEFFIGLDKLHAMTSGESGEQELLLSFMAFDSTKMRHAKYDAYVIGDEESGFAITELGNYSGDGGDALRFHEGMKFSTKDVDNDLYKESCAQIHHGGWWFKGWVKCLLTGLFRKSTTQISIDWRTSPEHPMTLQFAEMMLRPRQKK